MSHINELPGGRNENVSTGLQRNFMAMFDFKEGLSVGGYEHVFHQILKKWTTMHD